MQEGELPLSLGASPPPQRPQGVVPAERLHWAREQPPPEARGEEGSADGFMGLCLWLQATRRRRPLHLQTWAMCDSRELLLLWFLVLAVGGTEHVFRPG